MEPLGSYGRWLPPGPGLATGVLAVLVAAGLFELSRTLAEVARGRWYAGNGRDVFHAGAVAVLGAAYFVNGMPPALAFVVAALVAAVPLLLIDALPERRLIPLLLACSSLLLAALGLARSVWGFGLLRFLQVLCVAPVFPIVVARIAHRAGGGAIGVINSARIGAAFIGPVAATTLLAWTSPLILYACLGAVGAACVPVAWRGERAASAIART